MHYLPPTIIYIYIRDIVYRTQCRLVVYLHEPVEQCLRKQVAVLSNITVYVFIVELICHITKITISVIYVVWVSGAIAVTVVTFPQSRQTAAKKCNYPHAQSVIKIACYICRRPQRRGCLNIQNNGNSHHHPDHCRTLHQIHTVKRKR